ncbi:MAG: glycosyltransferase N-terminal domain-containing protein, partial [Planktomarina sp.]|nr:glycosyltransferase N-terminal domain-containing protein [Planktomarina sp.]
MTMSRRFTSRNSPISFIYQTVSPLIVVLAPILLRRRIIRGKEDPERVAEKLGLYKARRPKGELIWLHAVGLGEVLALRGLVNAMAKQNPKLNFLITSTARSAANVLKKNLPARTIHQYLPLDAPKYVSRFLNHWQPNLSIWSDQDLWPNVIFETYAKQIPLVLVNARLSKDGFMLRNQARGLYQDVLKRFSIILTQNTKTQDRLQNLGASNVRITKSLKVSAPRLPADPIEVSLLTALLVGRKIWVASSTHPGDEREAIAAQKELFAQNREWLLILIPRDIGRSAEIATNLLQAQLPFVSRSKGEKPSEKDTVWLADSYGELGLWYRIAANALIGGRFDKIGGHNPWEAVHLKTKVFYGPDTNNFEGDYKLLEDVGAAFMVEPGQLANALSTIKLNDDTAQVNAIVTNEKGNLKGLAEDFLKLLVEGHRV